MNKKALLIKLSGELLSANNTNTINSVISQIKELSSFYTIGIVIGGGNIFRGARQSKSLGISEPVGHEIGMLATVINGHILRDLLSKENISARLLSAFQTPSISKMISSCTIKDALDSNACIIFAGGTGNPFVTTDTNSVIRALQIGADEIWKASTIDGVYTKDPKIDPKAQQLKAVSYQEALDKKLGIMDQAALVMAQEHAIKIRVFDLFSDNALVSAHNDKNFGSTLS
jgi:uridylate kinase